MRASAAKVSPWPARLHAMAAGVLAGFLVGVPLGFLNRLYMRITALMDGHVEGFTWGGTLAVVLVSVLPFALPTGLLFPALRRRMRGRALVQGLVYCLLLRGARAVWRGTVPWPSWALAAVACWVSWSFRFCAMGRNLWPFAALSSK